MIDTVAGYKVRVFDSGPEFADRYTIVLIDHRLQHAMQPYSALCVGDKPESPNMGFSQWSAVSLHRLETSDQFRSIAFTDLPENVQEHVKARLAD